MGTTRFRSDHGLNLLAKAAIRAGGSTPSVPGIHGPRSVRTPGDRSLSLAVEAASRVPVLNVTGVPAPRSSSSSACSRGEAWKTQRVSEHRVATDDELVIALVAYTEQARTADVPAAMTPEFWVRNSDPRQVLDLLKRDPAVAAVLAAGSILRLAPHVGFAGDPWSALIGFVREALEPGVDASDEALRFLRFLRLDGGTVPASTRTTLFGFAVDEATELPFGQLLPATPRDLAVPEGSDVPPSAVFACVVDVAAGVTHDSNDMVWSIEDGEQLEAEMLERLDRDGLGRLLIALVFSHPAGPVQEHVVAFKPLYGDSFIGRDPLPPGPALASVRRRRDPPELDVRGLQEAAGLVARLPDPRRIVVASRRYFQAGSERARAADRLVDYATAVEALAGTSDGKEQSRWMVELLAPDSFWTHRVADDFKALKIARNSILHDGVTPPDARVLAGWTRTLVQHAITAAVHRDASVLS